MTSIKIFFKSMVAKPRCLLYNEYNRWEGENMFIKIEFDSEIPIYEQLRRQIIIGIAKGDLNPGEDLPSVRQLSGDIGINMHTVNKAYNILKDQGYLAIDRRKGAVIKENNSLSYESYMDSIIDELKYLAADSKNRGVKRKEFLKICSRIYDGFEKNK